MPTRRPLRALVAATAALGVLAGCGTPTVEGDELEKQISSSLEKKVGERPDAIECPDEVEAKAGTKARCLIKASDGSEIGLGVTMKNENGDFDYAVDNKVSKPPRK